MIGVRGVGVDIPELCRALLQSGISVALQSTLLLGLGLLTAGLLRRRGPALRSLIYQVTLASTMAGGLAALIVGRDFQPLWSVSLPAPADRPAQIAVPLGAIGSLPGAASRAAGAEAADPLALWAKVPFSLHGDPEGQHGSGASP